MARKKDATRFPFIIFVFILFGFMTFRKRPELKREAKEPLMFPRISRKPGRRISIPGINKILSVWIARIVPEIKPIIIHMI